jgi:hypothetical protein
MEIDQFWLILNICSLYRKYNPLYSEKNVMWSTWKLMCVWHSLPWIIWSNGVEGHSPLAF